MEEEKAWIEIILNRIRQDNSISKIINIKKESAVPEGNNYASLIYRATLDVLLGNGRKTKYTIIIKREHEVKEKSDMLAEFSLFKNEIKLYTEILSKMEQLMEDHLDNNDRLWCNLIGYKPYSCILFEDLTRRNFKMADRKKLLDKNHALLILNSLGRYHALGNILLRKGEIKKGDLQPYYLETESLVVDNMLEGGLKVICQTMHTDWSSEWKEIANKLIKQEKVVAKKLRELFTTDEKTFITICHGDCWTCNMMFKYCSYDDNLPVGMKFLDFQTAHINSFGFDLTYFLHVSVRPEVRRQHLNLLLEEYHKSLTNTFSFYGINSSIPTFDEIKSEVKRLQYYGFVILLIYLPITSTEVNDPFKMEKFNSIKEEFKHTEAYNSGIFKTDMYKNCVQADLKQWYDEGLF